MKATELRIGNYIKKRTGKVIQCDLNTIANVQRQGVFFKPIPLTEEWLLKFGFEEIGYGRVHNMKFIGYRFGVWDVYVIENGEFVLHKNTKETSIVNIKSVHHLQNIFQDLGEELKI